MANKDINKTFSLVITILIVVLGLTLSYWIYSFVNGNLVSNKKSVTEVKVDSELFQKISEPNSYGTSVTAEEEGYGRDNPFAPYKALPSAQEEAATSTEATPAP
jgi:hypothetical protein